MLLEKKGGMAQQRWRELDPKELRQKAISHLKQANAKHQQEPHAVNGASRALMALQMELEDQANG
jgi:hypothetical protein